MSFVDLESERGGAVRLHVQRLGPPSIDPATPTVVMLHGLLVGNLVTWYFTAAPQISRHAPVVMYDLRGHGRSQRVRGGYDVETMAADLAALVDDPSVVAPGSPLILVGHSWGALVALRYTLDHPGRVARLALVEAPLPPSKVTDLAAFTQRSPSEMLDALPGPLRETIASGRRQTRRFIEGLAFLIEHSSLLDDLTREGDLPDEVLARVGCLTLAIYGAESSCADVGERLARVLPRCELVTLAGGHYLPLDQPARLSQLLEGLVQGALGG